MRQLKCRVVLAVALSAVFAASTATATPMYTLATLATFNGLNGANPVAGLIADGSGDLYGTTVSGGANGDGTVFELAAGTHVLTMLVSFNFTNGYDPFAGMTSDLSGNLYGTTIGGGPNNEGTAFEVAAGTHVLISLAAR
jgi:uncharacterized repeat protein (TIGR03803 family)